MRIKQAFGLVLLSVTAATLVCRRRVVLFTFGREAIDFQAPRRVSPH